MEAYTKILFPTDLGEGSMQVARHVKEMASKFGAEVHIIYVAHVVSYYSTIQVPTTGIADLEGEIITAAENQLEELVENEFSGFQVSSKVLSGNPADGILEYAHDNGIDLIIMGHSRAGLERVLLGSVAHRIVKLSDIPVMIVRSSE
jgi:nucleotide-binding universal stress UspA family protein